MEKNVNSPYNKRLPFGNTFQLTQGSITFLRLGSVVRFCLRKVT